MTDFTRIHPSAFIHEAAHVSGAIIGARTKVWQFASVIRGTILGDDCVVASNVTLDGPKFGNRCIVSPGVDIGPGFIIGDDVFIGPNVVLCNDMWPRTHKDGFDYEALRSGALVAVEVENGASIGANAVVMPGVRIGCRAMIAAGAAVTRSVPPETLYKRDGSCESLHMFKQERMRGRL